MTHHSHSSHSHSVEQPAQTEGSLIRWAPYYDMFTNILTVGQAGRLRRVTVDQALIKPGDSVLDVGCGTGEVTLPAKTRAKHGSVYGIDPAPEMITVARNIEGQLTATLMATENDILEHANLVEEVKNICGRFILNGVPTGVEVCLSMQHGGPFPATTDSRFTSVGADGIKRFARPIAYQNWPDELLPDELKNANPLGIWRVVNDTVMRTSVIPV